MDWIDLRSDTVTLPTESMRLAMAEAEVGDDVYQEDPTINHLETIAAKRMGKESGLFIPSGTMGNLLAVMTWCNRGDEMILGDRSHTFLYEVGGAAAIAGVHPHTLPNKENGTLDLAAVENAIRTQNIHFPTTRLLVLENTHNACGGVPLSAAYTADAGRLAHEHGLKLHLDGARIFNAAAALDCTAGELTAPADSVTFCLSKGLAAPVGSVICGTKEFIDTARRNRKMLGGGMRQAGILAAAGIVALEGMTDRLAEDHKRTTQLAEALETLTGLTLLQGKPQSNMLFLRIDHPDIDADTVVARAFDKKIKLSARNRTDMRLVVHYQIDDMAVNRVVQLFTELLQ
ncbi:MAG: low-specificity L-threonine aldolase [Anaerolineales bacterium]|nr:low-specificity L-threonine aldolase [Anaerolineales bacterium]